MFRPRYRPERLYSSKSGTLPRPVLPTSHTSISSHSLRTAYGREPIILFQRGFCSFSRVSYMHSLVSYSSSYVSNSKSLVSSRNGRLSRHVRLYAGQYNISNFSTLQIPQNISFNTFTDPNAYYPKTEITDESVFAEMIANTPAHEPWSFMAGRVRNTPPRVGDFVEFRIGAEVQFGLLVSQPPCLFNSFHNRSIVLTIQNELLRVCVQDYTFVCSQVLQEESVPASDVLRNRFDESFPARRRLVQYLHQFLVLVAGYRARIDMSRVYSAVAGPETVSVSLYETAAGVAANLPNWEISREVARNPEKAVPAFFSSSKLNCLHQNALLMALYLNMCANPTDWIVPHCYDADRWSNVAVYHSSNALAPPPKFFANSVALSMTLNDFLGFSDIELSHISSFLSSRSGSAETQSPSEVYDQLTLDLAIGAPQLKKAMEAMKYALVYPHAGLTNQLSRIQAIGADCSPQGLYTVLKKIGLYDNPCNPLTDPVLSSQVVGAVLPKTAVACGARDLQPSHTFQVAKTEAKQFEDHFSHLRPDVHASGTQNIYIVPGSHRSLAFSLEQLNSRRYLLRIHIPDIASFLDPASETFKAWAQNPGESGERVFPPEVLTYMQFQAGNPSRSNFSVGDAQAADEKKETQACMTLTFEYNSSFEASLGNFQKLVQVTYERVAICRIVDIGAEVLEKTLTGRLEPSVFKKFRLFNQKSRSEPDPISDEAHFELNFVYNMMRRHFESRNRHSALNVAAKSIHKEIHKKMAVSDDLVHTKISLESGPDKCEFLRAEMELFAERLASGFCERLAVPVFRRRRRLIFSEPRPANDGVLIRHDNSLLPDFTSNSYFQAAYARDVSGNVSSSAFFHASNFVGPEDIGVGSTAEEMAHVTSGVDGYVRIGSFSMEAYLNQLQILQAVHFGSLGRVGIYQKTRDFGYLKALGYNMHGPSDISLLGSHAENLYTADQGSQYLQEKQNRYWKLKAVEMNPDAYRQMKCTVSRVTRDIDMQETANGQAQQHIHVFCEDLGMEVLMLTEPETRTAIGTAKIASVYCVDAISGLLILV